MILFLDFDGVLHSSDVWLKNVHPTSAGYFSEDERKWLTDKGRKLVRCADPFFEHAQRLADALEDRPVDIVISSSWRSHFSLQRLGSFLPPALEQRVVGNTAVIDESNPDGMRLFECQTWLNMRAMANCPWLALDDMPELFFAGRNPAPPNLIWCKSHFDEAAAAELRAKVRAIELAGENWREALAEAHREMGEK